jgi:uncharacterized protein (TIGR00297 family)
MMLERALAGLIVVAMVVMLARHAGSLSTSGALAATAVGTASVAAGWRWGALLLLYFVAAMLLTRVGAGEKAVRTRPIIAKTGARDAIQVIVNGGVFAACALAAQLDPQSSGSTFVAAALGALAASSADSWATEVGTLYGGTPRSMLGMRPVPPGTSGAVSVAGSVAMAAGALFVAIAAHFLAIPSHVGVVGAAGVAGAMVDSLLGATLQERRWCAMCDCSSERLVHDCGTPTSLAGGREWMNNDLVNLFATLAGALVAAVLVTL